MTPVFTWAPTVSNSTGTVTATVDSAKFGDGYQQRTAPGLNNMASSFSLQWVGDESKIRAIRSFLRDRGGWQSFTWTPVLWDAPGLFYCETWSEPTKDGRVFTITATFQQTFAP
ncbi:phage tail protein [Burkholderia sp. USMB20]|uniref:phage tail protein n=1 Tax=Burkholderia sp. USMB20 TaxID=1571773 RepID=UPI0005CF6101|nr:phage tail protein [Burkholderia sp. USMB20]TGN96127.1 phage tail protein [Burkholderia sp. USMB20]